MKLRTKRLLYFAALIVGCVLLASLLFLVSRVGKNARVGVTQTVITGFDAACQSYKSEYGGYPAGDLKSVFAALRGKNSNEIVFLQMQERYVNQFGIPTDLWGTPYHMTRSINDASGTGLLAPFGFDRAAPHIFSAGPDKIFETKDDITNGFSG